VSANDSRSTRITRITKVAGSLGARVSGIDLHDPAPEQQASLRTLLLEHLVLVLPEQDLTPAELVGVAKLWGTPTVHSIVPHIDGHPEVIEIRNFGKRVTLNEHWHSDVSFEARPPMLTLLHAIDVPEVGGDTQFANQYMAWETLSEGMRRMLEPLRAVHSGELLARVMGSKKAPSAIHPVARIHPETGRRALYVCEAFTRHFEDMSAAESKPILHFLYRHACRPDFTARHRWSPGDLVIWDNRCVQHYAIHDHDDAGRVLNRVTVEGETPV
jgi:taurine dioxygenase